MDIKSLFAKLKPTKKSANRNPEKSLTPSLVLSVVGVLVLVADVWALQSAARLVYRYKFEDVGARPAQSTRVNFDAYNKAVGRIEAFAEYEPEKPQAANPFKQKPK